jgi:hypothetical protein
MPQTPGNGVTQGSHRARFDQAQTRMVVGKSCRPSSEVVGIGGALQAGGRRFDPGTLHH